MQGNRGRDTTPELRLRRAVHALGLRYYVDRPPVRSLRRRADLVFPRIRLAVFVDGCYWHGCPDHHAPPRTNADYWAAKVERNRRRDADTDLRLREAGWTVIRVWEHRVPEEAAAEVATVVKELRHPEAGHLADADRPQVPAATSDGRCSDTC